MTGPAASDDTAPPVAARPSTGFTWTVRAAAVIGAAVVVGLYLTDVVARDGRSGPAPFSVIIGGLAAGGARVLWRWAGQRRLSHQQQWAVAAALRGGRRRDLARALRRGQPPPAGIEGWAVPYARTQHELVALAGIQLLTAAVLFTAVSAQWPPTGFGWTSAALPAAIAVAAGTMLRRVRRIKRAARAWTTRLRCDPNTVHD